MYVVDQPFSIIWDIYSDTVGLTQDYFDVVVTSPTGGLTYYTDPLTSFVSPNNLPGVSSRGTGTYIFTPTTRGRWNVKLVNGNAFGYDVIDELDFYVFCDLVSGERIQPATKYTQSKACP